MFARPADKLRHNENHNLRKQRRNIVNLKYVFSEPVEKPLQTSPGRPCNRTKL